MAERALLLLPLLPLLLLGCRGASSGAPELRRPPSRIGVIGAGIGGSSAAYFLRQKFGREARIDVFERGAVGGRLATVQLEGRDFEAGGAVLHPLNLHMKHFVKELGLSVPQGQDGLMGIYNGEEFVFEESSWYVWTLLKLFWRYGLNPLRIYMWVEEVLEKFMRIYRYQSHDYAFSSPETLLHALGGTAFLHMLNQTIDESLQKARFSQAFINEMVTPIMRVNYGQSASINGFVGAVSLAGASGGLWSVEGGNKLVCSGLLYASKAQLVSGPVISIEAKTRPKGRAGGLTKQYEVTYNSTSGETSGVYDILLIATPLQRKIANITFRNFDPPIPEFSPPYHQTVATFVHGHINASFFGYRDPSQFSLKAILTMEDPHLFVSSLGVVSPVKGSHLGPPVWKVFSHRLLTDEQLKLLFSSYDLVEVQKWLAYPHYAPPQKCPPFVLHDHMYYVNAIEWAASAMEMSAISAKNAALLAHHHWYNKMDRIDQEDLHERLKTEL
ncbi:prenylcysteine oxidase 1 [Pseudonaja textilis]|uniref:Prenylcysteine oxidase 1 n=1 Tax=Pseudonaja textilis TaxID=8673 RepID=A0A670ZMC5_PSETE|nr:prenylcysteine oxidase 1 [Pseudonaja textilis]